MIYVAYSVIGAYTFFVSKWLVEFFINTSRT